MTSRTPARLLRQPGQERPPEHLVLAVTHVETQDFATTTACDTTCPPAPGWAGPQLRDRELDVAGFRRAPSRAVAAAVGGVALGAFIAAGADDLSRFGLDQLLQDQADGLADESVAADSNRTCARAHTTDGSAPRGQGDAGDGPQRGSSYTALKSAPGSPDRWA